MNNKEKIQEKLQTYKQELEKYKQLFLDDDGKIDSDEQAELDEMLAIITELEGELNGSDITSEDTVDGDVLSQMEGILDRIENILIAWADNSGSYDNIP